MSSFLCFICHSTVNADTNEDTREKYREVVGMHLCPDSHLCHICCHVLNKLALFRAVCLKRSLEYPVLFSEKGTINLQRNDLEFLTLCPEESCSQYHSRNINSKTYNLHCHSENFGKFDQFDQFHHHNELVNQYVELRDENVNYFKTEEKRFDNECLDTSNHLNQNNNLQSFNENTEEYSESTEDGYSENNQNDSINECYTENCQDNLNHQNIQQYGNQLSFHGENFQQTGEKFEDNYANVLLQPIHNEINLNTVIHYNIPSIDKHSFTYLEDNQRKIDNTNEIKTDIITTTNDIEIHLETNQAQKNLDQDQDADKTQIDDKIDIKNENNQDDNNMDHEIDTPSTDHQEINLKVEQEETTDEKPKKKKTKNKKPPKRVLLTIEQQKAMLDKKRKELKYLDAEFKCYNCAMAFLFKDTYQVHMMRHEESNGEYKCQICTLRFASPSVLRAHLACHARLPCVKCERMRCRCGSQREASCHMCGRTFRDSSGLQQHLKRFHRQCRNRACVCGVCATALSTRAAVRTHMIKHITRKFLCNQCPARFSSPYTLNQHKKKHSMGPQFYYCVTCNIEYSSRKSLMAHRRNALVHQTTVLECPICTRSCPNQRSLASHMESVHSSVKNYACTLCAKRYTNRKSLLRHMKSHERKPEVKKAVCHLCGKNFKGTSKLNRHLREVCEKVKLEEQMDNLYERVMNDG